MLLFYNCIVAKQTVEYIDFFRDQQSLNKAVWTFLRVYYLMSGLLSYL